MTYRSLIAVAVQVHRTCSAARILVNLSMCLGALCLLQAAVLAAPPTLTSIAVTPPSASIAVGAVQQFVALGTYSNGRTKDITKSVTWTSSDTAVATIVTGGRTAGVATGRSIGTVHISAALGAISSGSNSSASLVVRAPVLTAIAVTPSSATIKVGQTLQFVASGLFSDGSTQNITEAVAWSTSAPAIATVSSRGLAQGLGKGKATIRATLGTLSAQATLTVRAATVRAVVVTPATAVIALGRTQQFVAVATYADGTTQDVTALSTWSSSNLAVSSVNTSGLAMSVAVGSASISGTFTGVTGTAALTITAPVVTSIVVTPVNPAIAVGQTQQFTATGTLSNGVTQVLTTGVTWTSGTPATATISSAGLVTGVASGITQITAASGVVSSSTTLTVSPPLAISTFSPPNGAVDVPLVPTFSVSFSRPIDAATLTVNTSDAQCTGSWQVSSDNFVTCVRMDSAPQPNLDTYEVTPAQSLTGSRSYAVRINTQVRDATGHSLPATFISGFTTTDASIQSITVTPTGLTLGLGTSTQMVATAALTDGTTRDVASSAAWSVAPVARGVISSAGVYKMLASGAATVSATVGSQTGAANITGAGLTRGRSFHTATLLTNGQVLIAGGTGTGGATATAELFDPVTGIFVQTGPMSVARSGHTATRLLDGRVLVVGGANSTGPLASAEVYDPNTGSWTPTGSMAAGRTDHAAALVGTQVLVVGGNLGGASGATATAELFDPATGVFTPTGALTTARYYATATVLADGQVLVAGGTRGGSNPPVTDAESYSSATGVWSSAGILGTSHVQHTATLLSTNRVLVIGGSTDIAEVYDPATGQWTETGSTAGSRVGHRATLLPTGRVLVTGGTLTESYDPETGTFELVPSLAYARGNHTATLLSNGSVLVAGGGSGIVTATAEIRTPGTATLTTLTVTPSTRTVTIGNTASYSVNGVFSDGSTVALTGLATWAATPSSIAALATTTGSFHAVGAGIATVTATWNSFQGVASMVATAVTSTTVSGYPVVGLMHVRANHTATPLTNGQVLIAGGTEPLGISTAGGVTATAELFDPATGSFTGTGAMSVARTGHTATRLLDGRVLVVGGANATGTLASAEVYDPGTGSWLPVGSMESGRSDHGAALVGNKVLVAGGNLGGTAGATGTAELYDPATGAFTPTGALTTARFGATATALLDGQVLVVGGTPGGASPPLQDAERYDATTGTWTPAGTLTTARAQHRATLLSTGSVLVSGGSTATAEVYDPTTGQWMPAGNMALGRVGHTATLLPSGRVLVAGAGITEIYDQNAGTFGAAPPLVYARAYHTATLLQDGRVLLVGGGNGTATAEIRPADTATLTALTISPNTRTVTVGGSTNFDAIGVFSDGSTVRLTGLADWSVASGSAAIKVSATGGFRGIGVGTATVTATFGGFSADASLIVQ